MIITASECKSILQKITAKPSRVVIVHHWDTDGIASCTMMLKYLMENKVEAVNVIPQIGMYGVDAIDIDVINHINPDSILILDYALKQRDLEILEKELEKPILLIDHHINVYDKRLRMTRIYNPTVFSEGKASYPSTTWVLREILNLPLNLYVILGVVGDIGRSIVKHAFWSEIKEYIDDKGWSLDSVIEACETLDAASRALNAGIVERAPYRLLGYNTPYEVVSDDEWSSVRWGIEKELARLLEIAKLVIEDGHIKVFKFESPYLLVSAVGRTLARRYQDSIVVVVFDVKNYKEYIYVRSYSYDLTYALQELRRQGLNIGGKNEVFSIQLESKGQVGYVLSKVLELLKKL